MSQPEGVLPTTKRAREEHERVALHVLTAAERPLTAREVEDRASMGLVNTLGALERLAMRGKIGKRDPDTGHRTGRLNLNPDRPRQPVYARKGKLGPKGTA